MKACQNRLRAALVAVLTLALLLGPCLSINGFTASSVAHAHGNAPAAGSHHGHITGGHGEHAITSSKHDQGDDSPLTCEGLCEGLAIHTTQRDVAVVLPSPQGGGDIPGLLQDDAFERDAVFPPIRTGFIAGDAPLDTASVYALTSRYRL